MISYKKLSILLFFYLLAVLLSESLHAQSPDTLKPKNVLILSSLEPAQPALEIIIENLKEKIRSEYGHPVNFYMDFLEKTRFNDEKRISNFFDYLNVKYKTTKFELLISIGPGMYPEIEKYNIPIFDSLPKIYNEMYIAESGNNYNIQGKNIETVLYDLEIEKNIKCALDLKPDTKNIFVFTGASDFDIMLNLLYSSALRQFESKFNINIFQGLTVGSLINKLSNLPEKSIVFIPTYQRDSAGTSYYGRDILQTVSRSSNSPIFILFSTAVNYGSVGGYVVSMDELGTVIGETAVNMLSGTKNDSANKYLHNFSKYMFDWKQLQKWNIDEKKLPEGSIIINREYTFFELYYSYLIAGIIFIIIETSLLIILYNFYRKQKNLSLTIIEQENRYKTLVDYNRLSALSELTASLSHQLNQPLTAILSTSQASLRFLKNDKYDKTLFEEILGNIVEDVKRASNIMNSLRSMIKKEVREKKRVNINKIANDVFILFSGQAAILDVVVEVGYDKSEPFVYADPILIQQVILNLLMNALEALENSDIRPKNIFLKTKVNNGYTNISVTDNGPGIPDSIRQDILKPFFTTKKNGLGIGLAICRSIIEDHHEKIHFENNKSGGAVFTFNLKLFDERI